MTRADDDAERSDEEEWRMNPADDDAERSDEEEWRMTPAGDDAVWAPPAAQRRGERSDEKERRS
jgi:hypothetical protein